MDSMFAEGTSFNQSLFEWIVSAGIVAEGVFDDAKRLKKRHRDGFINKIRRLS